MEHVAKTSLPPEVWVRSAQNATTRHCLCSTRLRRSGIPDESITPEDEATGPPGMTGTLEVELVQ
eukprot:3542655-Rhodomonas_salina.1